MDKPDPASSILIVGTGALACLFAARLAGSGASVTLLGSWPEGLEALSRDGVHLVDPEGREHTYSVRATADPEDCTGIPYALVLVKSWQTERAAAQLRRCLPRNGLALSLQNGLGNREILVKALGADRVALGSTTSGAHLLSPGRVQDAGNGTTSLGAHPRLQPLANRLRSSGFIVEMTPDLDSLLWGKLVINAAINPVTALLGLPNGELLERPAALDLMAAAACEAAAVAEALAVRLPYPDPVAAAENTARRTAHNRSSMLQDVQRGAPTEIDAISGKIVEMGAQTGVPTPVNRTLWLLVKALQPASSTWPVSAWKIAAEKAKI